MAKGQITIGVASDTGEFSKGIADGVVKPLVDADTTLNELASTSQEASDKIEAALKAQQVATTQNATSHRKATQQINQDNQEQVESFELTSMEQNRIQKESLKAGAGALATTLAQTATSFDGTATGILDTGTNILATLGAVMPGIGGLIAGAGTLLLGVLSGVFNKTSDDTKNLTQDVSDLSDEMIKAGHAGASAFSDVSDALEKLATETDPTKVSLEGIWDAAKAGGDNFKASALAIASNSKNLQELTKAGKEKLAVDQDQLKLDEINAARQQENTTYNALHDADLVVAADRKKIAGQQDLNKYLDDAATKAKEAAKQYKLWVDAGGPQIQELTDRTKDLDQALVDSVSDSGKFYDKNGAFDPTKFIKAMDAETKALQNYNSELSNSKLSTAAKEYLDSLSEQDQAKYLAGYEKASPAIKAKLNADWTTLGKANSGNYAKAFSSTSVDAPKVKTPTITQSQINDFRKDVQKKITATPLTVTVNYKIGKRVT